VVSYGGRSVLTGQMTGGTLLAFFLTVTIISGPMGSLASLYARLQRAVGAADRLFSLLDTSPEPPDAPDALPFPEGSGRITFEKIDFAYAPDLPVLHELSLAVPAGQVTALVGASGAGKTTLALLLYRFYEPQVGCIRIDGVPIAQIRRRELREHIGLVPQEPILFNGTIRENIRYGRLDATDAEIEAAARAAHVAEFVEGLPQGYDTPLGERGVTLSGGQRQRVAIARALLKNPRILLLDEATSALDTRSEALVRDALERLMQGRTTLVIAHRLTTIQHADQIAVLHEGQVAELGTHAVLIERGERYASLQGAGL
jgi:ATP-binding cassette, subfamily B, bacterial MsbA